MKVIQNLIGTGILGYGAYLSTLGGYDQYKGYAAVGGGIIYLIMSNIEKLKSFIPNFSKKVVSEQVFKPDEYEFYDTTCLVHLRNRCLAHNSVDGVETCAKLNSIIFGFKNVEEVNKEPQGEKV